MAYNLGSLVEILQQILSPNEHQRWVLDQSEVAQIKTLSEKASILLNRLSDFSSVSHDAVDSLEDQIQDAAENAEDILESHIAERIRANRGSKKFTISPPDLQKSIDQFESALQEMDIKEIKDPNQKSDRNARSSGSNPKPNKVVGLTRDLEQLTDRVTGDSLDLEIIPIVGMGGIGKTTLARHIYEKCSVNSLFDTWAWATISESYSPDKILRDLLFCITGTPKAEMLGLSNDQLKLTLYQRLEDRRYLIVLDDIWSVEPWEDLNNYFPQDGKSSRIILTTREAALAKQVNPQSTHHNMSLLDEEDSWTVLKDVVGEKNYPAKLEKVGRRIAKGCRGLPLAIRVIGGVLLKEDRNQVFWERIANGVSSTIANNDEQYSRIFSLSYRHLPYHLKPCFLYMVAFPEDHEIRASKLVKLWVAEGFLTPNKDKSLEEAAEKYIESLVDRNLIYQQDGNGYVKTYSIHDLLRDMGLRKSREKNFLHVKNGKNQSLPKETSSQRRISVHSSFRIRDVYWSEERMPLSRSFLCLAPASRAILSPVFFGLSLLKVLDVLGMEDFRQFPNEILQLVNLRYLAFACGSDLPEYLSTLENLQILIVRLISSSSTEYPSCTSEIFDMAQLRHVKFIGRVPIYNFEGERSLVQKNLQSLSNIAISEVQMILETVPNLRKLGIFFDISPSKVIDLTCLDKLETLKCFADSSSEIDTYLSYINYPDSLKKLTLRNCIINQSSMNIVGHLPNLEFLILQNNVFEGSTWKLSEGDFPHLRYLLLEKLNLSKWLANDTHFPELEHLVIRNCSELEQIASDFGEITTLKIIEVDEFSPSIMASAMNIKREQSENGIDIDVRIRPVRQSEKFVEMCKFSSFI